jgi:hypothetical protein
MAEVQISSEADELAVALVSALARQDGDAAMSLSHALGPLIENRPALLARHAAWTAQAHQIRGERSEAIAKVAQAIALATSAGETDALPALKTLEVQLMTGKSAAAGNLPLPDTLLGRSVAALDLGDFTEGAKLARQARIDAQARGNPRDEVLSLLALARIPGQEDSAIRAAATVADASEDKNLVTAVSRAARAARIALPKKVF